MEHHFRDLGQTISVTREEDLSAIYFHQILPFAVLFFPVLLSLKAK